MITLLTYWTKVPWRWRFVDSYSSLRRWPSYFHYYFGQSKAELGPGEKAAVSLFGWKLIVWLFVRRWGMRQQIVSPSHCCGWTEQLACFHCELIYNATYNPLSRIWEVLFKLIQCISGLVSALNTAKSYFSCHYLTLFVTQISK